MIYSGYDSTHIAIFLPLIVNEKINRKPLYFPVITPHSLNTVDLHNVLD
ncbi:hypothetical protein GMES_3390 [Paraglaciecola mesophila KMM 241]|uniref:Uncharacterized protein n=1 Tax=Paraglaciecola mesophila KMM 241 TaxID=1128912 RepID=K6Z5J9_9ALTE|nr:hypothetical protein GMES_3390 [Paraglaciecola mesophila KMM 241]